MGEQRGTLVLHSGHWGPQSQRMTGRGRARAPAKVHSAYEGWDSDEVQRYAKTAARGRGAVGRTDMQRGGQGGITVRLCYAI